MWKKIRFILLIIALFALVSYIFNIRLGFLEPKVRDSLKNLTRDEISFERIDYKFVNRIVVRNLKVGNTLFCKEVTLNINPFTFVKNPDKPELFIEHIDLDTPVVNIEPGFMNNHALGSNGISFKKLPRMSLVWDNCKLTSKYLSFDNCRGNLDVNDRVAGVLLAETGGQKLNIKVEAENNDDNLNGYAKIGTTGASFLANIDMAFHYDKDSQFKINMFMPLIKYKAFELLNSTGTFIFTKELIRSQIANNAIMISLEGKNIKNMDYRATYDFSKLNDLMSGKLVVKGNTNEEGINGKVNVVDLIYDKQFYGSTGFTYKYDNKNNLVWKSVNSKDKYFIDFNLAGSDDISVVFRDNKNVSGRFFGKISPLNLKIDVANMPITGIQLLLLNSPLPVRGSISAKGNISDDNSFLKISGADWRAGNNEPTSFDAELVEKNKKWQFKSHSLNKDWYIEVNLKNEKDWDIYINLSEFQVRKILPWINSKMPVQCKVSGILDYAANNTGKVNVKLKDLSWKEHNLGDGIIDFDLSKGMASLHNLTLYNNKGTLNGNGRIELNSKKSNCNMSLKFHNYSYEGTMLNGDVLLEGDFINPATWNPPSKDGGEMRSHSSLEGDRFKYPRTQGVATDKKWKFNGNVRSEEIGINDWPRKKLTAGVLLTKDKLEIRNYIWQGLSTGKILVNFKDKAISGNMALTNIPIANLLHGARGELDGSVVLSGKFKSPAATLNYVLKNAKFKKYDFNQYGSLSYQNNSLIIQDLKISSGTSSVELKGKVWPSLDMRGTCRAVPMHVVNSLYKLPFNISGNATAVFALKGGYENPEITIDADIRNISAYKKTMDEIKFKINVKDKQYKINQLYAKYSDSEINLTRGSMMDFKKKEFMLKAEGRNIRIGPFEIFGGLGLSGKWSFDKSDRIDIVSTITTKKLWINQHNLENMTIGLEYKDNKIIFRPKSSNENIRISGIIGLSSYPKLFFEHLNISSKNNGSFLLNGEIGKTRLNFNVTGKSIAAQTVSELTDLPVFVDGDLNVSIAAEGTLEKPNLKGEINLTQGSVSNVPFDSFNIQFLTKNNNVLSIPKIRMTKKEKYTIVGSGYFPFYLTGTSKKTIKDRDINLTLNMDNGNLSILSDLSNDIKSAKGEINSRVTLTGTLNKIVANGYLKVKKAEVRSRRYFNKLSKLNIYCLWKNNVLSIKEFTGNIGKGEMALNGKIVFKKLKPKTFDLTWQSVGKNGISISVPELPIPSSLFSSSRMDILTNYSQGEPKFFIKLKGPADNILLSGWVEMENTHFTYPSIVKDTREEDVFSGLWPRITWDLELRSGKNTWYENELVSANTSGGIKLLGKGGYPKVEGKVEAISGTVTYLGKEFKIDRAVFETKNEIAYLEGEAEIEVYGKDKNSYDTIKLYLDKSRIEDIKPRFVSKNDLNMTSEQAFQKATGLDSTDTTTSTNLAFRKDLVRFFGSNLTTPVARNLLKRTGLADTFRIQYVDDTSAAASIVTQTNKQTLTDILAGTKYSLEKSLNDKVLVGYAVTLDDLQDKLDMRQELELSYRWTKNLFLKGLYQIPTNNPFMQYDQRIMLEHQWRFGSVNKNKEKAKRQ